MAFTKTISFLGTIRSLTFLLSKFIMAAMRLRSWSLRMLLGVRRKTSMKSESVAGVYLGGVLGLAGRSRYFSSLGSRNLTIFFKKLNHMI